MFYTFVKYFNTLALFCYYKKIKRVNYEPKSKGQGVLYLANHQNALLDVLIIATRIKEPIYFLTRADVFSNGLLRWLFASLNMIPIYRVRDGRKQLALNEAVFEKTAQLLQEGRSVLIFPEASHSLDKRIRTISKGFTRILNVQAQLEKSKPLQACLIGVNYHAPKEIGDQMSLHFSSYIDLPHKVLTTKETQELVRQFSETFKTLSLHLEPNTYEQDLQRIQEAQIDLSDLKSVQNVLNQTAVLPKKKSSSPLQKAIHFLWFALPMTLYKLTFSRLVNEAEFEGTFRYGFGMLLFSLLLISGVYLQQPILLLGTIIYLVLSMILIKKWSLFP